MHRLIVAARKTALDPRLGYDLVRMYVGLALFVRGALFVADPERVVSLARRSTEWFWPLFIAHAVGIGHISGGILLTVGLATRVASLVQVPILFGAVFFVHWREGLLGASQSLELSGLVLFLLLVFSVFGAGPLSLDYLVFRREEPVARPGEGEAASKPKETEGEKPRPPGLGRPSATYP